MYILLLLLLKVKVLSSPSLFYTTVNLLFGLASYMLVVGINIKVVRGIAVLAVEGEDITIKGMWYKKERLLIEICHYVLHFYEQNMLVALGHVSTVEEKTYTFLARYFLLF